MSTVPTYPIADAKVPSPDGILVYALTLGLRCLGRDTRGFFPCCIGLKRDVPANVAVD